MEEILPEKLAEDEDRLLTTREVATLFRVDRVTVTRWARAGKLPHVKTPGGHRRFRESHVRAQLADIIVGVEVTA